jgi:hypothetical protein
MKELPWANAAALRLEAWWDTVWELLSGTSTAGESAASTVAVLQLARWLEQC